MSRRALSNVDPATQDLRALLGREHEILEVLFEDLVHALESGDDEGVRSYLSELDRALHEHLWMEERHFFPVLVALDAALVRSLRAEHDLLRERFAALRVPAPASERAAAARRLVAGLREHTHREEERVYPSVEENLGPHVQADLKRRIRERLVRVAERARSLRRTSARASETTRSGDPR